MSFTIGTGTFTNGSATVTNVSLSSGTLAYFASGTRMVVGVDPVTAEVEAIAAPSVTSITLRSAWPHTGGTYSFLANQTSEGLRDAVQAIRTNNTSLQSFIDSIDTAATADSVAQRTSTGAIKAANALNTDEAVVLGQLPDDVADLYAKNNIIGTVSEFAGVPTGAIIEYGSNANGEYVKYADGTMLCWRSVTVPSATAVTTVSGDNYRSTGGITILPATYATSDFSCTISNSTGYVASVRPVSTADFAINLHSERIISSTASDALFRVIAIGRWF